MILENKIYVELTIWKCLKSLRKVLQGTWILKMESYWDQLNKQCDLNEQSLQALEKQLDKMPCSADAWFYLDPNKLKRKSHKSQPLHISCSTDGLQSFVTVVTANQDLGRQLDKSDAELNGRSEQVYASNLELNVSQEESLKEVLNDPKLPLNIKEFITQKTDESLNESDTVCFCQYVMGYEKAFSDVAGTMLFKIILYPKIRDLENTFLSVVLLEKIQELTNTFPSFIVNGVIIPLISNETLGKQQLDVVCVMVNGMKEEALSTAIKGILMALSTDENALKLFQTVINRKPKLDVETAFLLVTKLQQFSVGHSSDVQLGKILLAAIPILNKKLSTPSLELLREVVNQHKTFLKGKSLNLLNELEPI